MDAIKYDPIATRDVLVDWWTYERAFKINSNESSVVALGIPEQRIAKVYIDPRKHLQGICISQKLVW